MRRHWTVLGIAVVAAALWVGGVACGDDGDQTRGPTTTARAPTATAAQPADTPQATSPATPGESATVLASDNTTLGQILVDAEGRTLYKFANDQANVSNCSDACAGLWPPLTISGGTPSAGAGVTGQLGTIQRSDGSMQVTLDGTPLYRFANDTAPGDTNGEGFAGLWSVIRLSD